MKCPESIRHCEVEGLRVGRFKLRNTTTSICYRIGSTLLDTGPSNQWRAIRAFIEKRPLHQILLTHHHEDHSGNAARIQAQTQAAVFAPASALERLAAGFQLYPYQRFFWGLAKPVVAQPLPSEVQLDGGFRLRVLPAPGHSRDMVCFLEPERGW
ncbi:MAG: MBL fold metallo-hydrolase, partial [Nitrospiraceae bacterium]|nr:MBL fold metallo-hydrolase [Nitrospiraceae bacterium]